MKFRRLLKIFALVVAGVMVALGFMLGPQFWNMRSEYMTAGTIRELKTYVEEHAGEWPASPAALGGGDRKGVWIDYSMTSDRILATPELLKEAVRPVSGKFYTYPRYHEDLESLLEVIQETNTGSAKNPVGRKDGPAE